LAFSHKLALEEEVVPNGMAFFIYSRNLSCRIKKVYSFLLFHWWKV